MNPVHIFVSNSKSRANQEAGVMLAQGYDVVVSGPTDSVTVMILEGDNMAEEAWANPFPQMWVVFCFNPT